MSPESNVELLFDLDNAGEVFSNPNSSLLFAIAFCCEMNPRDLSVSWCGEVILWSLVVQYHVKFVNQVELRSHFPFKLYCGLWVIHVIMTHFVYMITQKWLVITESDIGLERKSWNDSYFSAESTFQESGVNKTFTCARTKKSDVAATFRSHSV